MRTWTVVENVGVQPVGSEYVSSCVLDCCAGITKETIAQAQVWSPHNSICAELTWQSYTMPQQGVNELGAEVTLPVCFSAAAIRLWA